MWPNWKCPWCDKQIAQLGARPSLESPKWNQLTRQVSVCPNCNQPVRHSSRGRLWLLLAFPFLIAMIVEVFALPHSYMSDQVKIALGILAVVGGVLFRLTTRLEKAHAI